MGFFGVWDPESTEHRIGAFLNWDAVFRTMVVGKMLFPHNVFLHISIYPQFTAFLL